MSFLFSVNESVNNTDTAKVSIFLHCGRKDMSVSNEDLLDVSAMQETTERDLFEVQQKSVSKIH